MDRRRAVLVATILASGVVFLDSTLVNVALPRIGRDLPHLWLAVLEGQSYVYTGYLLTLSSLLILAGAISDRYGRRRMFGLGLVGFGLASLLCGLAPNLESLVVFRLLQGAAGALLVPGSLALISASFEGEERGRAIGLWAASSSVTTLLGPLVGGFLVDTYSWRLAFLVNVPLIAIALAALRWVGESRDEEGSGGFHWLGAGLVFVATGGLSFGVIYGQQRNWQDPLAYAILVAGAIATALLAPAMRRTRHPLVPPALFRSRAFTVINVSTLLIYGALYLFGYYNSLFVQGVLGYTAAAAGTIGIPTGLLLALLSSRFGSLAGRRGPRLFLTVGPLLMAAGLLWLTRIPASSPAWRLRPGDPSSYLPPAGLLIDILPATLLFGVGLAILVAPLTTALMASIPVANSGVGSAVNNAISRIGPQLAGALLFVAITAVFYARLAALAPGHDALALRQAVSPLNPATGALAGAARQASTDAYHVAMLITAALLAAGAAANWFGLRGGLPASLDTHPGSPPRAGEAAA